MQGCALMHSRKLSQRACVWKAARARHALVISPAQLAAMLVSSTLWILASIRSQWNLLSLEKTAGRASTGGSKPRQAVRLQIQAKPRTASKPPRKCLIFSRSDLPLMGFKSPYFGQPIHSITWSIWSSNSWNFWPPSTPIYRQIRCFKSPCSAKPWPLEHLPPSYSPGTSLTRPQKNDLQPLDCGPFSVAFSYFSGQPNGHCRIFLYKRCFLDQASCNSMVHFGHGRQTMCWSLTNFGFCNLAS